MITVSERESCEDTAKSPVCDTDDEEHANVCHLLRTGKVLAYNGPCLVRKIAKHLVLNVLSIISVEKYLDTFLFMFHLFRRNYALLANFIRIKKSSSSQRFSKRNICM